MEGKRNRGEVTAELSEKVWARLCRENALVIKLDRSYKVQDQRAQKQIEPGGKLKSFTAFAPDSETVPVTVKVMAPGEKEPRSERCYCIVNPGLQ